MRSRTTRRPPPAAPRKRSARRSSPPARLAIGVAAWAIDLALFTDALGRGSPASLPRVVLASAPVLVAILLRWRYPVASVLVVSACVPPAVLFLDWTPVLTVAVCVYAVAATASRRISLACAAVAVCAHAFALVVEVERLPDLDRTGALIGVGTVYLLVEAAAWALGRWSGAVRERTAELERQRVQAVAEERMRISRDLHDIVAHSVTVMLVHAAAGRRAQTHGQDGAQEALTVIEDVGRQTVAELRRMLGLLREDTPPVDPSPLPDLRSVPVLVETAERSGLVVDVRTIGTPVPLDPSVELAAYRTLQEGLTNVLRHAGAGARVAFALDWSPAALTLTVDDDGRGRDAMSREDRAALSTGTGLIGLGERVAVAGGSLTASPRPEGGWRLRVVFPVPHHEDEPVRPGAVVPPSQALQADAVPGPPAATADSRP